MDRADDYVLGRGLADSVRLDAQYMLWKFYQGYELHPRIPIKGHMKIAELGTGTGIWLFDVAKQVPSTVQLHGYDISESQFPPRDLWPSNVSLRAMTSLADPPPSLKGQYDGVHLRLWACIIRESDIGPVIRHAKSLLKPGGYLQWEEADLGNVVTQGEITQHFEAKLHGIYRGLHLDFRWISELPNRLRQEGLQVLESKRGRFDSYSIQLCTRTFLLAFEEIFHGIKKAASPDLHQCVVEQEAMLHDMFGQAKNGMIYNWTPVSVLARREE